MAVQFDSTVGGDASTSYVSDAYSLQYFENISTTRYNNWNGLTDTERQQALNGATKYIDSKYTWSMGQVVTETQALSWPRYDAYNKDGQYIESTEIPEEVMAATCELAYLSFDFTGSTPVEQSLIGEVGRTVKKEKLDGVGEVEYFSGSDSLGRYFPQIDMMLSGLISSNSIGGLTVSLRRA